MTPAKTTVDITDPNLAKAMAHPLRVRILAVLDSGDASPSAIADEIGVRVENVAYHVRMLHQYGLIELVRRIHRGAAVEHLYRLVARPRVTDDAWARTPRVVKRAYTAAFLDDVGRQVARSAEGGGFDPEDIHVTRRRMRLDAEGWAEAAAAYVELTERLQAIEAASGQRLQHGPDGEQGRSAVGVLMLFEDARAPVAAAAEAPAPAAPAPAAARA